MTALLATQTRQGTVEFLRLPDGRWHTTKMEKRFAEHIFKRLESVRWLKLRPEVTEPSETE